jgi:hypothetical protein
MDRIDGPKNFTGASLARKRRKRHGTDHRGYRSMDDSSSHHVCHLRVRVGDREQGAGP